MTKPLCFSTDTPISTLLKKSQEILSAHSDSALLDAQILLSFALAKARSYLFTWPEKTLNNCQLETYIGLLKRRQLGEPIAYIVGEKEFWSLPLKVSPATLIPRPDTETLVEQVLDFYSDVERLNCLDLGTGTGAIALALSVEKPLWHIEAIDYFAEAVALAQQNANTLGLAQVNIYQSNWFSAVSTDKKFDVIVSNPPYIDQSDSNLTQGDVRFEPKSALVAEQHGLADIQHIAKAARAYLLPKGRLIFEHGYQQGQAVRDILQKLAYVQADTVQDLNGHDRITWAIWP